MATWTSPPAAAPTRSAGPAPPPPRRATGQAARPPGGLARGAVRLLRSPGTSPLRSQGARRLRAVCLTATGPLPERLTLMRQQRAKAAKKREEEKDDTLTMKKRKIGREVRGGSVSAGDQRAATHLPPPGMDMENKGKQKKRKRGREEEGGSASDVDMEKKGKKKKRKRRREGGGETPLDLSSVSASASTGHNAMKFEKIQRLNELEKEAAALRAEIAQHDAEGEGNCQGYSYYEFLKIYNDRNIQFSTFGLENEYNTCFVNVILHCFAFTRPFLVYLLGDTYGKECSKSEEEWCLLCAMQRYIRSARDCKSSYYPTDIISHMQMIAGDRFILGLQQDASEFMMHAKNKMESDFFAKHAGDVHTPVENIIHHMFGGVLRSEITCPTCTNVSTNDSKIMDLVVEIQDPAQSLHDCLHMFTALELLDACYKCPRCKKNVRPRKRLSIYESPNILTITLQRFKGVGKLNKVIHYPVELDITEYMSSTGGDNMYDLYAVVTHVGSSTSGHYMCYVKDYEGHWLLLNDKQVNIVSENKVQHKDAYMLLYIRRTARAEPPIALKQTMEQKQDDGRSAACEITSQMDKKEKEKSTLPCNSVLPEQPQLFKQLHKLRSLTNSDINANRAKRIKECYLIAEDTEKSVVLEKIKKVLKFYKKTGHFELPSCGKKSFIYDDVLKQICMIKRGTYFSRSSTKAKRIAVVLKIIREHLQQNTFIQQRSIYYLNKLLFEFKSHISDNIVNEVCLLLECTRMSLNITVSAGGSIIGPIVLYVNSHIKIDCWRSGTGGSRIPHEAHQVNKIVARGKVNFILIVEKETIFSILAELQLHRKYSCIMITGGGQPDLATRAIIHKLRCTFPVPVYGFVDMNPFGIRILCTFKFGSERRAFDNLDLTVHDLRWIGLHPSDLDWKPGLSVLNEADYAILVNLLDLVRVHSAEWGHKLIQMLYSGLKADIEQVLDYHEFEGYLSKRIVEMNDYPQQKGKIKGKHLK